MRPTKSYQAIKRRRRRYYWSVGKSFDHCLQHGTLMHDELPTAEIIVRAHQLHLHVAEQLVNRENNVAMAIGTVPVCGCPEVRA